MESFLAICGNELKIVLAQKDVVMYFTRTHIADLKAVIKSEPGELGEEADNQDNVAVAR
jgi:hypothetical protein